MADREITVDGVKYIRADTVRKIIDIDSFEFEEVDGGIAVKYDDTTLVIFRWDGVMYRCDDIDEDEMPFKTNDCCEVMTDREAGE